MVRLRGGCGWLQGKKEGMGGAPQAKGIGVKEMLTDTINVICLLPQEVGCSLYWLFVPSTVSALALHGFEVWKNPETAQKIWYHTAAL